MRDGSIGDRDAEVHKYNIVGGRKNTESDTKIRYKTG